MISSCTKRRTFFTIASAKRSAYLKSDGESGCWILISASARHSPTPARFTAASSIWAAALRRGASYYRKSRMRPHYRMIESLETSTSTSSVLRSPPEMDGSKSYGIANLLAREGHFEEPDDMM